MSLPKRIPWTLILFLVAALIPVLGSRYYTFVWTAALVALDQQALTVEVVQDTLGVILKYQDDITRVNGETTKQLIERAQALG